MKNPIFCVWVVGGGLSSLSFTEVNAVITHITAILSDDIFFFKSLAPLGSLSLQAPTLVQMKN